MTKFQIPFYRNFKYFDPEKIEISIKYKPKIKELDDFLSTYQNYRIIIIVQQELTFKDFQIFKALLEKYNNFTIRYFDYNKKIEEIFNSYNLPHYYQYIICNLEDFLGFCSLNVTDIRIGGNLAFSLEIIVNFTREKHILLRCFCNYCERKWDYLPAIKNFFIRPQDIPYYSNYIDVFEFKTDENFKFNLNTFYEIYGIKHKWLGRIKEIVYNYDTNENNHNIIPSFGIYRGRCQQKCLTDNNICKICERIVQLSQMLKVKNKILI